MKKIIAYVRPLRVQPLVQELQRAEISEIMVTEYFSPLSQVSRFVFVCDDGILERIRQIIRLVGTGGDPTDYFVDVSEYTPKSFDPIPMGVRMTRLDDE